jgi:hypothetical protein
LNLKIINTTPKIFIPRVKNEAGKFFTTHAFSKYWYLKYSFKKHFSEMPKEVREKIGIYRLRNEIQNVLYDKVQVHRFFRY